MSKSNLADLRAMLVYAEARCFDSDWIVRMDARREVTELTKRIIRAERAAKRNESKLSASQTGPQNEDNSLLDRGAGI